MLVPARLRLDLVEVDVDVLVNVVVDVNLNVELDVAALTTRSHHLRQHPHNRLQELDASLISTLPEELPHPEDIKRGGRFHGFTASDLVVLRTVGL